MISYKDFKDLLILDEDDVALAVDLLDKYGSRDVSDHILASDKVIVKPPRLVSTKDSSIKLNKIVRPQGIIVQDTWNNFIFPIQPKPRIDTAHFDVHEVFKRFRELYTSFVMDFLPWHYVIEMIGSKYYIFQTRPIDMKFPMTNEEVLNSQNNLEDDVTKKFFENKTYQIENMIHVCLIGDTNLDVYPQKLYRLIGRICIRPFFRDMRITGSVETRVIGFNIGRHFNLGTVKRFARK